VLQTSLKVINVRTGIGLLLSGGGAALGTSEYLLYKVASVGMSAFGFDALISGGDYKKYTLRLENILHVLDANAAPEMVQKLEHELVQFWQFCELTNQKLDSNPVFQKAVDKYSELQSASEQEVVNAMILLDKKRAEVDEQLRQKRLVKVAVTGVLAGLTGSGVVGHYLAKGFKQAGALVEQLLPEWRQNWSTGFDYLFNNYSQPSSANIVTPETLTSMSTPDIPAPNAYIEIKGLGRLTPEELNQFTIHAPDRIQGYVGGLSDALQDQLAEQVPEYLPIEQHSAWVDQRLQQLLRTTTVPFPDGKQYALYDVAQNEQLWVKRPDELGLRLSAGNRIEYFNVETKEAIPLNKVYLYLEVKPIDATIALNTTTQQHALDSVEEVLAPASIQSQEQMAMQNRARVDGILLPT
jgi:hypothetical protein